MFDCAAALLEIDRSRQQQGARRAQAQAGEVRFGPVGLVGHIGDGGTQRHGAARDARDVARAQVEHGAPGDGQRVVGAQVLPRCGGGMSRQRQALQGGHVPLRAELALPPGQARGLLALFGGHHGPGHFGVGIGDAAHQAHAAQRRAEEAPFHAPVALLAAEREDVGDGVGVAARALDLIEAEGVGEVAQVELDAHFLLPGLVGREDLAGVGGGVGRHGALAQALDVVGVDGHLVRGLDQQRHGGRGGAFLVAGAGARASVGVEGFVEHLLAAHAQRQQHRVLCEGQRVGHAEAGQARVRAGQGRDVGRAQGLGAPYRVVDVGHPVLGQQVAEAAERVLLGVVGGVERELVAHRARAGLAPEAGLRRLALQAVGDTAEVDAEIAGRVDDLARAHVGVELGLADTGGGIGRQPLAQVDLAAHHGALVTAVVEGPGRVPRNVGLRRPGHGQAGRQREAPCQAPGAVLAAVQVGRNARPRAAPVQPQGGQAHGLVLGVHGGLAIAVDTVEADAELLVLAEAAAQVDMAAEVRPGLVAGSQARQGIVARALGHEVDGPTRRALGRHAVEQGGRALEHLHALEHLGRTAVVGGHAGQAVDRHVVHVGGQAPDGVALVALPRDATHEHGGVRFGDHLADVAGLLVGHEPVGVGDGGERCLHEVLVAQQAHAGAGADLATGIDGPAGLLLDGDGGQGCGLLHVRCDGRLRQHGLRSQGHAEQQCLVHGQRRAVPREAGMAGLPCSARGRWMGMTPGHGMGGSSPQASVAVALDHVVDHQLQGAHAGSGDVPGLRIGKDHAAVLPGLGLAQQGVDQRLGGEGRLAFHHGRAVHHVEDVGVGLLDEFAGHGLAMQAGFGRGAGRLHAQRAEDEAIARLRPERAEGAVVVQHDQGLLGAAFGHTPGLGQPGVQLGSLLAGEVLLAEDAAQGQEVVLDDVDVAGLAVAVVHVEVDGGGDLAEFLVVAGLQRGDQDQVGPGGVHALQVGLDDGAHVCNGGIVLVAGEKVRHEVLGHARDGHAQRVEEVDLVHVQRDHALRQPADHGGAQLVLRGDGLPASVAVAAISRASAWRRLGGWTFMAILLRNGMLCRPAPIRGGGRIGSCAAPHAQHQREKPGAAGQVDQDADGGTVVEDMLDRELGQDEEADGDGTAHGQGGAVPEAARQRIGGVGHEDAHEGRGPEQAGRYRHQHGDQREVQPHGARVVHAQGDGVVAAQREHVQRRQGPHPGQAHGCDDHGRDDQLPRAGLAEGCLAEALQHGELAGADLELHELREGGDHHGQHQAQQQQKIHVAPGIAQQPAVQGPGIAQHQHGGQREVAIGAEQHQALRAQHQQQQGLQQQVDRLVAHDGGRQDPVAGEGLEHDGRPGHADSAEDHGRQPGQALGDDVVQVQPRAEKHEGQGQGQNRHPGGMPANAGHHRLLRRMRTRNSTPPTPPAVRPMGTSNGCISSRPRMSQPSSSEAPPSATRGRSDEGNGPDGDDRGGHGDGHQHQAQGRRGRVVQAQAGGHALAQAQHGEALREQVGQRHDGQHQVDDFVVALNDPGKIAQQPALHALQDVVAIGVELGHGAEHAAVHQADHGNEYCVPEADPAHDGHEDQAGGKGKDQREQHPDRRPAGGRHRQPHQDAELGRVQPA
ncbi:hypothetical protein FQR65_LT20412 [Abscondita terminalis]|nr:hypothetical protein FQR65_LT20412 [Abscondita terminalis]